MAESALAASKMIEQTSKVVLKRHGKVTLGDIMSDTGLSQNDAKSALDHLILTHEGSLRVSENGDLLYAFSPNFSLRDHPSWWMRHKETLKKWIKTCLKVFIMLVMLFYFIIPFSILYLPLSGIIRMLVFIFPDKDRNRRRFRKFWGFMFGHNFEESFKNEDDRDYKTPLHTRFFNFVFGAEEIHLDLLAESKLKLTRLIHYKKGVLTVEDWILVTGDSLEKAESDLARMTAEFGGNVEITDNGTLIYVFEDMMKSSAVSHRAYAPSYAWNQLDPPIPLSGNKYGGNRAIIIMNTLILLFFGMLTYFAIDDILYNPSIDPGNVTFKFFLAFLPFLMSLIAFLVPLFRLPHNIQINRMLRKRALREAALSAFEPFFHNQTHKTIHISKSDFQNAITKCLSVFNLTPLKNAKELDQTLFTLCHDFGGHDTSETFGKFSFDALSTRLMDATAVRNKRHLDRQTLGNFVYSSDSEEQAQFDREMEMRDFASFDQALNSAHIASDLNRGGSASLQDIDQNGVSSSDALSENNILEEFYKNRDHIIDVLREALLTRDYTSAKTLIHRYDPSHIHDDNYSTLVQQIDKNGHFSARFAHIENILETFLFETIVCPKTFWFFLFCGFLLFGDTCHQGYYGAAAAIAIATLIIDVLCTDLWINPLKKAPDIAKTVTGIILFLIVCGLVLPDMSTAQSQQPVTGQPSTESISPGTAP